MSVKKLDRSGRWRSKIVAFRMSEEENGELNRLVSLSGMTKQDYIISRLLCRDVVVVPSSRVLKALHDEIGSLQHELRKAEAEQALPQETAELLGVIAKILNGLGGEETTPEVAIANHSMATLEREPDEDGRGLAAPWKVQPAPLSTLNSSSDRGSGRDAE